jgi:tripartite-type tricarboxylate transporter receptor subunit TctC
VKNKGARMKSLRTLPLLLTAALFSALLSEMQDARAISYPEGKVFVIDPYAPGGGIDLLTRILAQGLGTRWNQPVVVENRVGASGIVGAEDVARSAPDGHTLLIIPLDVVINPQVFTRKSDDLLKKIKPIASLAITNYVIAASPSKGYGSLADLIASARANPGAVSYGTCGSGAPGRLVIQGLEAAAHVSFNYVPYRGGCAPAVNDASGSHIDFVISGSGTVVQPIKSGMLKPIAIGSKGRDAALPDTPTLEEAGYPNIAIDGWFGLFAPSGTPDAIAQQLYAALKTVYDAATLRKINQLYLKPDLTSPADFRRRYESDTADLGPLMQNLGVDE